MANQLAPSARDDVTPSTPRIAGLQSDDRDVCAAGLLGVSACFAVYDISVAFLHSRMDEVVFVPSPETDQLVMPGFCWRLQEMHRTRRASRLWADTVKFVLRRAGCFVLRTMSMVFRHRVDKCMLAVWGRRLRNRWCARSLATAHLLCCPRTSRARSLESWARQVWLCETLEQDHRGQARRLGVAHRRETCSCTDRTGGTRRGDQQASANSWEQVLPRESRQCRRPAAQRR